MQNNYPFSLSFPKKDNQLVIFSLPQTNQYQTVSNIKFREKTPVIVEGQWKNKIAIFEHQNSGIIFNCQPKEIRQIISSQFSLKDYSLKHCHLKKSRFINGSDLQVLKLSEMIIKKEKDLNRIIYKIFNFVLEYLSYGKPIKGLHSYKQALTERVTDCGGFSTFMASLMQSIGIPCRLVAGFLLRENFHTKLLSILKFHLNFDFLVMHAWLEILLPDKSWFPLDASMEWRRIKGLTKRQGGYGYIPADRLVLSFGDDFSVDIKNKTYCIDILQHPIYLR